MRQKSTTLRKRAGGVDLRLDAAAAARLVRRPGPGTREPRARASPRL